MKKHTACFWLNKIIKEKVEDHARLIAAGPVKQTQVDAKGKETTLSDEEFKWRKKVFAETIERLVSELEALEIAAESLTR